MIKVLSIIRNASYPDLYMKSLMCLVAHMLNMKTLNRLTARHLKVVFVRQASTTKIGIVGVPFEKGQTKVGVGNGPAYIRRAGLVEKLQSIRKFTKRGIKNLAEGLKAELDFR